MKQLQLLYAAPAGCVEQSNHAEKYLHYKGELDMSTIHSLASHLLGRDPRENGAHWTHEDMIGIFMTASVRMVKTGNNWKDNQNWSG